VKRSKNAWAERTQSRILGLFALIDHGLVQKDDEKWPSEHHLPGAR